MLKFLSRDNAPGGVGWLIAGLGNPGPKYDLTRHPRYKYLSDADPKNKFDVDRFLASMRRRKKLVVTQDEVFDLYDIDLSDEDAAAF